MYIKTPSDEDKKILQKQLQLLSEKSDLRLSAADLISISNAMARLEAVIIGYEKEMR